MSGADWDAILEAQPELTELDLTDLDLEEVTSKLGALPNDKRQLLIAAIDAEKAKVEKRSRIVDTALDVFGKLLTAVT